MKLNELLSGFAKVDSPLEIAGIALNSREVKSGYLFIALPDATANYVQQAIEQGAVAILFEHDGTNFQKGQDFSLAVAWVGVENLADKLAEIAARFYHYPARSLDIIGITGTNGKTSCSQFLAQVLSDSMVIGTLGFGTWGKVEFTGYTTPNAVVLQKILAETVALGKKTVVMEVSSHGVQEKRIEQTLFKGAVFTNLSRDHLDYHNSMEEYFNAKLQLFKRPELQFAVVNRDDDYGQRIIAQVSPSVALWTFSRQEQISSARCVIAKNIHCSIKGISFEVCHDNQTSLIKSRLYGEFNVENMLAVLTTLLALGFSLTEAAEKISALQSVPGRMEYFGGEDKPSVFVDFAHTPDALEKVLQTLKHHQPKSLSVVFGCGGNRDSGKRAIMGAIAEKYADKVIITDDNPRFEEGDAIIADILSGCKNQHLNVIRDRTLAIQTAISQATNDDCVIVAGKGHENYQEVKGIKTPFSDQAIVKHALLNVATMTAGLFGLKNSNRDFSKMDAWGKNQFNSSFPAALSCYLHSKNLGANYISMSNNLFAINSISFDDVFKINPLSPNVYFAFEAQYTPFQKYVVNTLPRTDLVLLDNLTGQCLRGLEVKLTALPDNTTCHLSDEKYGSEIVIRPDTIVYLAASIASTSISIVEKIIKNSAILVTDWSDANEVIANVEKIINCISTISLEIEKQQLPFLLQPVWKTIGKSSKLADNCLDVFIWSDAAFAWFIAQVSKSECTGNKITRQTRTSIWLYKMLLDIVELGRFDHVDIIDKLSYNTKNDKAFASAGNVTNVYMTCENLRKPRILKNEIKNIILGGGQNLLSPERRFDAIIFNSPELF